MSQAKDSKQKISQTPRWLWYLIPFVVVVFWLLAGGLGGPFFGRLGEVSDNSVESFLPESAESTRVADKISEIQYDSGVPLIAAFEAGEPLTDKQIASLEKTRDEISKLSAVDGDVAPLIISDDKEAALLVVPLDDDRTREGIEKINSLVDDQSLSINYKLTGPAAYVQDLRNAYTGIDNTLLIFTLVVVFVILLAVYRSPILPIVTLVGSMLALSASVFVVWHMADAGIVSLNGQVQGILFILVIGAATDYSLLYIARYREELARQKNKLEATKASWRASVAPIVAAGGTVTLGLLCLLVSDLASNQALGPVGGVGIAFAILLALTYLPVVLLIFGEKAFWPRAPKKSDKNKSDRQAYPAWSKVGGFVSKNPRKIWVGVLVVLIVMSLGVTQLRIGQVAQEDVIVGESGSREGQEIISKHFAPGVGSSPSVVLAPESEQDRVVDLLDKSGHVNGVTIVNSNDDMPQVPIGQSRHTAENEIKEEISRKRDDQLRQIREGINHSMSGMPQDVAEQVYADAYSQVPSFETMFENVSPFKGVKPKTIDGSVVLMANLAYSPGSVEALDAISDIRSGIAKEGLGAKVGGASASQLDVNETSIRDMKIVMPLILLSVTLVLMLLLRSVVAPLLLAATNLLSLLAAVGVSAILFNVLGMPSVNPAIVIFTFVFLVSLGIDYSIFLMTRAREETIKNGVKKGTIKALVVTGGVITSAGVVLAATFASLATIPMLFLVQIAFMVSFGVLVDTFIVRSLLVPALVLEIGDSTWWPSKIVKSKKSSTKQPKGGK